MMAVRHGRGVRDCSGEDGGLDGLITAWETTAATIAAGFDLSLDDYLNDLDARQIVEVVLAAIPEPDGPLIARLRVVDERVRVATTPARGCLLGSGCFARLDRAAQLVVLRAPPQPR